MLQNLLNVDLIHEYSAPSALGKSNHHVCSASQKIKAYHTYH